MPLHREANHAAVRNLCSSFNGSLLYSHYFDLQHHSQLKEHISALVVHNAVHAQHAAMTSLAHLVSQKSG